MSSMFLGFQWTIIQWILCVHFWLHDDLLFGHRENLLKALVNVCRAEIVMNISEVTSSGYSYGFYGFMEESVYISRHFYGIVGIPVCWTVSTKELTVRRAPQTHIRKFWLSIFVFYKFRVWITFSVLQYCKKNYFTKHKCHHQKESIRLNNT